MKIMHDVSVQEQKRSPMTLARIRAVANSPTGFETITPQGARELLDEISAVSPLCPTEGPGSHAHDLAELRATTATLERVRAARNHVCTLMHISELAQNVVRWLDAALAGQPEAPKGQEGEEPSEWELEQAFWATHRVERFDLDECGSGYMSYRDMRKSNDGDWVRSEDYRRDLAAANARIAERDRELSRLTVVAEERGRSNNVLLSRVSVANARIAELEQRQASLRDYADLKDLSEDAPRAREAIRAANARADAAERALTVSQQVDLAEMRDPFKCAGCEHGHPNWHRYNCHVTKSDMTRAKAALLHQDDLDECERLARDLAAANAQIAELEADNTRARNLARQSQEDYDGQRKATEAANARADAAERERNEADRSNDGLVEQIATVQIEATELRAERDQLAARVKELSGDLTTERASFRDLTATRCTPEERAVLEAMRDYPEYILEDWKREGTPLRKALAHAELANRAAKAKRGGA